MSTKVNVRLPDALHATVIDTAKSRGVTLTAVIVGTLNTALGLQPGPAIPAAMVPARRTRAADVVAAIGSKVTVASKLPPVPVRPERGAATPPGCPRHGSGCGFPKAGAWWCAKDQRIVAAAS
jgi:hypothetical protein